jgi:hypothetical protein
LPESRLKDRESIQKHLKLSNVQITKKHFDEEKLYLNENLMFSQFDSPNISLGIKIDSESDLKKMYNLSDNQLVNLKVTNIDFFDKRLLIEYELLNIKNVVSEKELEEYESLKN